MRFIEIINNKKLTLISIFLFLYVMINLFEGERGLISYYEKQKTKEQLIQEKESPGSARDIISRKEVLDRLGADCFKK